MQPEVERLKVNYLFCKQRYRMIKKATGPNKIRKIGQEKF